MVKVAINGYGRIGRVAHRIITQWHDSEMEVVAINAGSSTDLKGWMYLLKYDTTYGPLDMEMSVTENTDESKKDFLGTMSINGKTIQVYSQRDPSLLPWKDLGVDVVIESTGAFSMPNASSIIFATGVMQLVVHDALLIIFSPLYSLSLIEST
jgi:glyceraldehyde 3-phosphate dehydrogenase